jgi:hypothetical protein
MIGSTAGYYILLHPSILGVRSKPFFEVFPLSKGDRGPYLQLVRGAAEPGTVDGEQGLMRYAARQSEGLQEKGSNWPSFPASKQTSIHLLNKSAGPDATSVPICLTNTKAASTKEGIHCIQQLEARRRECVRPFWG